MSENTAEEIRLAVAKLRDLEETAALYQARSRDLQQEVQELKLAQQRAATALLDARNNSRNSRKKVRQFEQEEKVARESFERKQQRMTEVNAWSHHYRSLAERARTFLESGGASIDELEAGVAMSKRGSEPAAAVANGGGSQAGVYAQLNGGTEQ